MVCEAGKAVKRFSSSVDHFPGHGDIILYKRSAAADAADAADGISARAPANSRAASFFIVFPSPKQTKRKILISSSVAL